MNKGLKKGLKITGVTVAVILVQSDNYCEKRGQ